jgi:poly(A) polymerase
MFDRGPGPWLRPIKEHLLGLVIDGLLAPDDKEEAAKIARMLIEQQDSAGGRETQGTNMKETSR